MELQATETRARPSASATPPDDSAALGIGAVARLAGMSVDALRKWEARHKVVTPRRSAGNKRLYSREDVSRLLLVRRLVDAGAPLGEVATSSLSDLEAKIRALPRPLRDASDDLEVPGVAAGVQPLRVAVVGDSLPPGLSRPGRARAGRAELQVVASAEAIDELPEGIASMRAELLVFEQPSITSATLDSVRAARAHVGARDVVVVYGFGPRGCIDSLQAQGHTTMPAPLRLADLEPVAAAASRRRDEAQPEQEPPPPRFTPRTIAKVAAMSPSIECECPTHIAELIIRLAAFERYSNECTTSNPAQQSLHRYLGRTAAQSRASFEAALARVAAMEGIDLEE